MSRNIHKAHKLTDVTSKNEISEDHFYHMLSAEALKRSIPYQVEERKALDALLRENLPFEQMNLLVVGCGDLWYIDLAIKYTKSYIGIDPLLSRHIHTPLEQLIQRYPYLTLLEKTFDTVQRKEFPSGNIVFVLMFNVAHYIENLLTCLNKLLRPGDLLFLSTWGQSKLAKHRQAKYYHYLNMSKRQEEFPLTVWQEEQHGFLWNELVYYRDHRCIRGETTDITIIYT